MENSSNTKITDISEITQISDSSLLAEKSAKQQSQLTKHSYDEADLDELCLWLYGIYEETTLKSGQP